MPFGDRNDILRARYEQATPGDNVASCFPIRFGSNRFADTESSSSEVTIIITFVVF